MYCNGSRSSANNVTRGAPQGSMLGSILVLYINDMVNASALNFVISGDDTCCYSSRNLFLDLICTANHEQMNIRK